jgi:flagellar hook-length control protein FliK
MPVAALSEPARSQLAEQIVSRAEMLSSEGRIEFHLRLEPPELGTVRVHLLAADETLTARLIVADEGARQVVESQLGHLRQSLAEAGFSHARCEVAGEGGRQGGGEAAWEQPPALAFEARPARVSSAHRGTREGSSLIDVVA